MPKQRKVKVFPGHYIYRNHNVYSEEVDGPEGGLRRYWSISGELGGPDEDFAHPELPQLDTLTWAQHWIDAHIDGRDEHGRFKAQIEQLGEPTCFND